MDKLAGLKELVTCGWEADNGFKMGYLVALEHHIRACIPDNNIKFDPYINSKFHVWKKAIWITEFHVVSFRIRLEWHR